MKLTFWGVRGTQPTSEKSEFGNHTISVQIEPQSQRESLIVDAGSGITLLGQEILNTTPKNEPLEITIALTHYHFDHIQGLPFFAPFFLPNASIHLIGPTSSIGLGPIETLDSFIRPPFFPISLKSFKAKLTETIVQSGSKINLKNGLSLSCLQGSDQDHPQKSMYYKVTEKNKDIACIWDYEFHEKSSATIAAFFKNADLAIIDAHFSIDDYEAKGVKGFGHSSIQGAINLKEQLNSQKTNLIHLNPDYDDIKLKLIEKDFDSNTSWARENSTLLI